MVQSSSAFTSIIIGKNQSDLQYREFKITFIIIAAMGAGMKINVAVPMLMGANIGKD